MSTAMMMGGVGMLLADSAGAGAAPESTITLDGLHSQVLAVTYSPSGNDSMSVMESGPSLANPAGGLTFQVPESDAGLTGTHAVYLTTAYTGPLSTSNVISAAANWAAVTYNTRSTTDSAAYGRLEIQDVTSGNYNMNDYWWYDPQRFDLNNSTSGSISAPLNDLSNWSNICGLTADVVSTATKYVTDCMTGKTLTESPNQGFRAALANVREVNISFGRTSAFASGIATTSTTPAYFNLTALAVN